MRVLIELCGFLAAGATILAYWQTDARPMRRWAIAANCCFIAYGALGDLMPPLMLHLFLLPLNLRMLLLLSQPQDGTPASRRDLLAIWRRTNHEVLTCGSNEGTPTGRSSTPSTTRR